MEGSTYPGSYDRYAQMQRSTELGNDRGTQWAGLWSWWMPPAGLRGGEFITGRALTLHPVALKHPGSPGVHLCTLQPRWHLYTLKLRCAKDQVPGITRLLWATHSDHSFPAFHFLGEFSSSSGLLPPLPSSRLTLQATVAL